MNLTKISKKIPYEDKRMTLSAINENMNKKFEQQLQSLDDKRKQLNQILKKKDNMRNKYSDEYHDLLKNIKKLEEDIQEIENKENKKEYLIKASLYFKQYTNNDDVVEESDSSNQFITVLKGSKGIVCKNYVKNCIGKGNALETSSDIKEIGQELICSDCKIEKLTNPRESYAYCPGCGEVVKYQDNQNNKGEYSEEVEVLSPFAYKRINHFKEWISTIMAREGSVPSQDIIDQILEELRKDCVKSKEQVTYDRIRGYLKKLGHSGLYEHVPAIIYKISGKKPPHISKELEAKLVEMFEKIQKPFDKHAPEDRKNFLSYSYTLHKMCLLLDQKEIAENLPLLKSREKLHNQDEVWKKICNELGWEFHRSL